MAKKLRYSNEGFLKEPKMKENLTKQWFFRSVPPSKKQTPIDKIFHGKKHGDHPPRIPKKVQFHAPSSAALPSSAMDSTDTPIMFVKKRSSTTKRVFDSSSLSEKTPTTLTYGSLNTIIDAKDVIQAIITNKKLKDQKRSGSLNVLENEGPPLSISRSSYSLNKYLPNDEETLSGNDSSHRYVTQSARFQSFLTNKNIFQKINMLRYRENVFRAASRLAEEMPPYPDWTYQNEEMKYMDFTKINVGGRIFYILEETLLNFLQTKLATCIKNHKSEGIPFFDRDPICFAAVVQMYRTGRLHTPPNICLTLFEEELEFWGVNEMLMEPCCWSSYDNFKMSSTTIKKYSEDMNKSETFKEIPNNFLYRLRKNIYFMMTSGSGSVVSRWLSLICTVFIIISVALAIFGTSPIARVDTVTNLYTEYQKDEFVSHFLGRTDASASAAWLDLVLTGYFLTELILRLLLCPAKLEFFSDTLNWVDLIATTTSLLSSRKLWPKSAGSLEGYLLVLKIPRILRLFKLTASLRSGMEAFILTLRASAKELKLVFLILFISISVFGSLLFVVEMVNETKKVPTHIENIFMGMWLAIVTMSTVGYGDITIASIVGYLVGSVCILCGVIICQLPVPVFLQNFRVYYNQATARFKHQSKLTVRYVDPEAINDAALSSKKQNKGKKTFIKLFNTIE